MIPPLNADAFKQLAEDLESPAIASDFLAAFDVLLSDRIQRIEQALKNQNEEEITTALLSLQASAAMVGAAQLDASTTRALAQQPTKSAPPGPLIRKLQGQADAFSDALSDFHHASYTPTTHKLARGA